MLVVVEPGWASLATAERIAALARDLGIHRTRVLANRISNAEDLAYVEARLGGLPLAGTLPRDPGLEVAAREGRVDWEGPFYRAMLEIARTLGS
jgi:CO dehydrogenase nickel-insertion accessory protein CooC1